MWYQRRSNVDADVRGVRRNDFCGKVIHMSLSPYPDVCRSEHIRHRRHGCHRFMEPRQGDRSLLGRLPLLEGHRHRPFKYEIPVQVHPEIRARIGRHIGVRSQSSRHDFSQGTEQLCPRLVAISEKSKDDWFVWRTVCDSHCWYPFKNIVAYNGHVAKWGVFWY